MLKRRLRFKQSESLQDRLRAFENNVRALAAKLPPSSERDELLRKARQAEAASHIDEWVNSPGLQPPK